LAALLVVGLPLFICMPLWVDVTHYDLCARNLLEGGVPYRDAFDTNLPGIVWLQASIRFLVGWSSEAIRIVDILIYTAIVGLFLSLLAKMGRSWAVRAWTAVVLYAYYLTTSEMCHCQRDMWMLLPTLLALHLRYRQMVGLAGSTRSGKNTASWAAVEGFCWGLAFWIKPFVAIPALLCWLISALWLRRARGTSFGLLAADTAGLLGGALIAGGLGIAWLLGSGTWPYFWEVMLEWNPEYRAAFSSPAFRRSRILDWAFEYFPWSLVHLLAIPLAVAILWRAVVRPDFSRELGVPPQVTGPDPQPLLASLYLGWLGQAVALQYPHDYVLAPTLLPALVLIAGRIRLGAEAAERRLWVGAGVFLIGIWGALMATHYPVFAPRWLGLWIRYFQSQRLALWARCLQEGSTPKIRDTLALGPAYGRVDWQDLERVAAYLRSQNVRDGELECFNDTTHPLYLELGVKPSTRFFQFSMAVNAFINHREQIRCELQSHRPRFIVSDLYMARFVVKHQEMGVSWNWIRAQKPGPVSAFTIPVPKGTLFFYPMTEPAVFLAGRYVVLRARGPVSRFWR
jgi:hypothetical protein